jgi:hypothetical protein
MLSYIIHVYYHQSFLDSLCFFGRYLTIADNATELHHRVHGHKTGIRGQGFRSLTPVIMLFVMQERNGFE